ncbi:hypothetical protein GCM10027417_27630 [Glutamicibacter endophyticus]
MPIRLEPSTETRFESLSSLLNSPSLPKGRFTVEHNAVPIDFHYEDLGADVTIVLFHAALGPKVQNLPVFLGRNLVKEVRANRLFVSDPTLNAYSNLKLAWYAGSLLQPDLQFVLSAIFRRFSRAVNRTIFFGASGGGFASLFYSSQIPDSIAIPVNPQTSIAEYNQLAVDNYLRTAWNSKFDGSTIDNSISIVWNLVDHYDNDVRNTVVYVQNDQDLTHVESHWTPFMRRHNGSRFRYVIESFGEGHVAPPREYLTQLIMSTVAQ